MGLAAPSGCTPHNDEARQVKCRLKTVTLRIYFVENTLFFLKNGKKVHLTVDAYHESQSHTSNSRIHDGANLENETRQGIK